MQVYHKHFGKGTILSTIQKNGKIAYMIQFESLKTHRTISADFLEIL